MTLNRENACQPNEAVRLAVTETDMRAVMETDMRAVMKAVQSAEAKPSKLCNKIIDELTHQLRMLSNHFNVDDTTPVAALLTACNQINRSKIVIYQPVDPSLDSLMVDLEIKLLIGRVLEINGMPVRLTGIMCENVRLVTDPHSLEDHTVCTFSVNLVAETDEHP